jgi:hypothetical protein
MQSSNNDESRVVFHAHSYTLQYTKHMPFFCALRSDLDRYAKHKKMVQQLYQDYAPSLKLMSYTPEYYATHIAENALDKHFSPRFSYLGCADSLEERYALRKALHDVLYASGLNCAFFPHLPLDRFGGTCFTVSLNRVNNDLNYLPSNVQVTCLASNLTFGNFPNGMAASFLNFFSRFIVTDEFDPRLDPIPQLQALPPTEVIIDDVALSAAIAKKTCRSHLQSSLSFIRFSLPSCCAGKLHTTRSRIPGSATAKRLLRGLPPTNRRAG